MGKVQKEWKGLKGLLRALGRKALIHPGHV